MTGTGDPWITDYARRHSFRLRRIGLDAEPGVSGSSVVLSIQRPVVAHQALHTVKIPARPLRGRWELLNLFERWRVSPKGHQGSPVLHRDVGVRGGQPRESLRPADQSLWRLQ